MYKQGRRVILIYKAHMHTEASLDPEKCTHKSDEKAKRRWIQTHLRQIDQYEDIASPDIDCQEDDTMEEDEADRGHLARIELPPNGSGAQTHTRAAHAPTVEDGTATGGAPPPPAPTRLRFGTPDPPILPVRSGGGTAPNNPNIEEHQNRFAPLR